MVEWKQELFPLGLQGSTPLYQLLHRRECFLLLDILVPNKDLA